MNPSDYLKKVTKHKYGAKPKVVDGKRYASQLEGRYAEKLELAKRSGDLLFYLSQVRFPLAKDVVYVVDFVEFWASKDDQPGDIIFTECKGFETPEWKLKYKLFLENYPWIELNLVKK